MWKIALVVVPLVAVTMVLAVLAVTYRGGGESAVVGANASTTTTSALPTEATAVPAPTAATAAPAPAPVQVPEPAPVPTTTPAPTVVQAPTAPTWEQIKGAQIPGFCTHPPTTLVEVGTSPWARIRDVSNSRRSFPAVLASSVDYRVPTDP